MKYLKYFENIKQVYKIGEFVIGQIDWDPDYVTKEEANDYLSHTAGEIVDVSINGDENDFVTLRYINLPIDMFEDCENIINYGLEEILRYATEDEINIFKLKEKASKFNL